MHRRAALLGAVLMGSAAPLEAQEISLLVGGVHARYADSLSGTAGVTSARLRARAGLRALDIHAGLSQFATGEWALQADGQATAFFALSRRIAAGIAGGGTVSDFEGGSWSGMGAAGPVIVLAGERFHVSIGASAGAVRSVDRVERAMGAGSFGMRYRAAPDLRVDLGVLGTVAEGDIGYADMTGSLTWRRGTFLLAASVGARAGDLADDPWGQVRIEYAPSATARLEAAVGRYPRDLTGFTDGLFVQAGIRLTAGSISRPTAPPAPPVQAQRVDQSRVRVTLRYHRTTTQLAIAGEFSGWEPVPLRRIHTGQWTVELPLEPGLHRYALIADGIWTLPDGVAGIDDGFGGKVGVLSVGS